MYVHLPKVRWHWHKIFLLIEWLWTRRSISYRRGQASIWISSWWECLVWLTDLWDCHLLPVLLSDLWLTPQLWPSSLRITLLVSNRNWRKSSSREWLTLEFISLSVSKKKNQIKYCRMGHGIVESSSFFSKNPNIEREAEKLKNSRLCAQCS